MKLRILLSFLLVCYSVPWTLFADSDNDNQKDLNTYKKYQEDQFRDFPTTGPGIPNRGGYGGGSTKGSNPYMQVKNFPAGDSRNFIVKTVMDKVTTLAQGLASTAGTGLAFDNANQLRSQANQLNATGNPTFAQMAALLKTEATQIENGDKVGATNTANQIGDLQRPYVSPSYTPGPQENLFADALGSIFGTIIQGALAVLGTTLVGKLLGALGLGGGSTAGAFGNGAGYVANSAINGQNPGSASTNASLGVLNAAGSDVNSATQRTIRQNVNDGSSGGGAPSATSK